MKITEHTPPAPPPSTFTLELTLDQLVGLGVLSFRHESILGDRDTFYRLLPEHIQRRVYLAVPATKSGVGGSSILAIDWLK